MLSVNLAVLFTVVVKNQLKRSCRYDVERKNINKGIGKKALVGLNALGKAVDYCNVTLKISSEQVKL